MANPGTLTLARESQEIARAMRRRPGAGSCETFAASRIEFLARPKAPRKEAAKANGEQDDDADEDEGLRGFRATAYSGAKIDRWYGKLILDLAGGKLGTQHGKLPMLVNHRDEHVAGYADEIAIGEGPVELAGYLSSATDHGQKVAQLADEGFPWTMSVGVMLNSIEDVQEGASADCNGESHPGPILIARQWDLIETSFITCNPADRDTDAEIMRASALQETVPMADPTKPNITSIEDLARARDEAAKGAENAARERLAGLQQAFPDRPAFAMKCFIAGKSIVEAQAAESLLLREELARLKAEPPRTDVSDLRRQAGVPAIGFSGPARETASAGPLSREQLNSLPPSHAAAAVWDRDVSVREEMLAASVATGIPAEELLGAFERSAHKRNGITTKMEQDVGASLGLPR